MDELLKSFEIKGKDVTAGFQKELAGFRTNRPHPGIVEEIKVEYGGQMMPLKHVASISIVPPREIQINVWDSSAVQAVEKAIESAKVGLNPSVHGSMVRVMLPPMSDERREELRRLIKTVAEKFRIQLRGMREEANKRIESMTKAKEITEDQKFKSREKIQKTVDSVNASIEELINRKFQEISE